MKSAFKVGMIVALCSSIGAASDLAVLRNGNSIRHERREVVGSITRLYLSNTGNGYIEIPTDQIEHFERDTAPPPSVVHTQTTSPALSALAKPRATNSAPANQFLFTPADVNTAVAGASARHQIDPDFINSVIRAESGFHTNAVSKKGAQGLMQLMPGTASQLGVTNAFDPKANVEGGTAYLRELLEKYNFDVPKALAAYNAGPKRVDQYHGIPPYYETQSYIARIIRDYNRKKLAEDPGLAKKASVHPSAALTKSNRASRSSKAASGQTQVAKTAAANSLPRSARPDPR